jgi:hypothetical protein
MQSIPAEEVSLAEFAVRANCVLAPRSIAATAWRAETM